MYNIDEIKLQNQQDCWSLMYLFIGGSIMEIHGRAGEGVIREAVRRYGRDRGNAMRERLEAAGYKTNLDTLFGIGSDRTVDPRFREDVLRADEQVRLWEVVTCPQAELWKAYDGAGIGHFYCEECNHAAFSTFGYGKVQTNLSKKLTDGDNFCRFSVYFRPANLAPELRGNCFPEFDEGYKAPEASALAPASTKESLNRLWLLMYYYFLEAATERFGTEGASAVALGLQNLACETASFLSEKADATGAKPDEAFLALNFPLALSSDSEPFWKDHDKYDAKKILDVNFYRHFKEDLGL